MSIKKDKTINMNEKLRHVIFMVSSVVRNTVTDKVLSHVLGVKDNESFESIFAAPSDSSKAPKAKLPSRKTPPLSTTKKGLKLWDDFWDKYSTDLKKMIKKTETDEKAWAAVVAFFRNYCLKRNVYPFESETTQKVSEDTTIYLQNRLNSGRNKIFDKVKKVITILKDNEVIKTINKETIDFIGFEHESAKFEVVTLITCPMVNKDASLLGNAKISSLLKNKEFTKKRSSTGVFYSWTQGPLEITIGMKNKTTLGIWLTQSYTTQQARLMVNYSEDFVPAKNTKATKEVSSGLAKIFKKLIKETGHISRVSVKAATIPGESSQVNTNPETLDEEEYKELNSLRKELQGLNVSQIISTYTLDMIRSLGSPAFQLALLNMLIATLVDKKANVPSLWATAAENPQMYLNPDMVDILEERSAETADI